MILTIASFKGGVGKTTTAVHLATYLQGKAPTLLIDGDPNRSATGWARRGSLPVKVVDERQGRRGCGHGLCSTRRVSKPARPASTSLRRCGRPSGKAGPLQALPRPSGHSTCRRSISMCHFGSMARSESSTPFCMIAPTMPRLSPVMRLKAAISAFSSAGW